MPNYKKNKTKKNLTTNSGKRQNIFLATTAVYDELLIITAKMNNI